MSEPETLGTRLRSLRAARGCSLSELARRSGVGKGTINIATAVPISTIAGSR